MLKFDQKHTLSLGFFTLKSVTCLYSLSKRPSFDSVGSILKRKNKCFGEKKDKILRNKNDELIY